MRRRIYLILGLIALIAITVTTVGTTVVFYRLFQKQVLHDLEQNANLLMETEVFQKVYDSGKDGFEGLGYLGSGEIRITWIDSDGTVLFDNDTDVSGLQNHLDRPEIQQAFERGAGASSRHSDTMDLRTFYYALLLDNGTVLRVSTRARTIYSVFFTALPVIVFISVVVLLSCILIGHLLTRQLMAPIEEMAENLDSGTGYPVYSELEPFAAKIRSQHESILAAAKVRQDFTANVTHELKTPITAITGYAELIENRLVDSDTTVHVAGQIRHNADRLLSLVTDIIKLSELDHKEIPRSYEKLDLFSVAKGCLEEYLPVAEKKQVHLVCSGEPVSINADQSLIREMIDNLVQNSIRYNREGGSVLIRVYTENSHPVVSVSDAGIGIPEDQLGLVFERFYRVDKSRSRETGGTGLGLAIVKHIAELHSAEISISSTVGKGTEIAVRF